MEPRIAVEDVIVRNQGPHELATTDGPIPLVGSSVWAQELVPSPEGCFIDVWQGCIDVKEGRRDAVLALLDTGRTFDILLPEIDAVVEDALPMYLGPDTPEGFICSFIARKITCSSKNS